MKTLIFAICASISTLYTYPLQANAPTHFYNSLRECVESNSYIECTKRRPNFHSGRLHFGQQARKEYMIQANHKIISQAGRYQECYKKYNSKKQGTVPLILKINPLGKVHHIGIEDMTYFNDMKVIRCVTMVLYSIQFPPHPNGEYVAIKKPFKFQLQNI